MKLIPTPIEGTRMVFVKENKDTDIPPFMKGNGSGNNCMNLLCGYCGTVLCESIQSGTVTNLVFKCPICNHYNDSQVH